MKHVKTRTLVLLVQLLVVVAAYQYLTWATPAQADAVWLDEDGGDPVDPNDPNAEEPADPQPEVAGIQSARIWLDEESEDPNEPGEPSQPIPETT
jgi:hypothetical protein